MATVARRRDSGWQLTHGRGKDRVRLTFKTRQEADAALRQLNKQLSLHGTAPRAISCSEARTRYSEYLEANRRRNTTKRYMRVIDTFVSCFLANWHPLIQSLADIKPAHLEDFKTRRSAGEIEEPLTPQEKAREARLRQELAAGIKYEDRGDYGVLGARRISKNVSKRTINYELRCLFSFFHWCVKRNFIFVNPVTNVERFKLPKRALPKFMTSDELRSFFAACNPRERRHYSAILFSGMRKGESEWLTWNDVNLELGVIFIQEKTIDDETWAPKTDERLIPVSPMLQAVLLEQWENRASSTWVFATETGTRETHTLDKLKAICKRAGIAPKTVHALRHSFGAHLRMAGVALADIADLLGHADLATTQIYAKVHQAHLREQVEKLSAVAQVAGVATQNCDTKTVFSEGDRPKALPS